jgi:hypothetical protein
VVVVAVLAVGQTLVFLTRNFDLSVGSITGFTAYFIGQQLWHHPEIPPVAAVLLAIGVGMVMGSINGVIVAYGRVLQSLRRSAPAIFSAFRSSTPTPSRSRPTTCRAGWSTPAMKLFSMGRVPLSIYPATW